MKPGPGRWPAEPLPPGYRLVRSKRRARQTHITKDSVPPWSTLCGLAFSVLAGQPLAEPVDPCPWCMRLVNWCETSPR
jgi:hypothetical protein